MTPPRNPKYGRRHDAERRKWAAIVGRGDAHCWRCGGWLDPTKAWDLGHGSDGEYRGAECVSCNRADGARTANRRRGRRRNGFSSAKSGEPKQPVDNSPWAAKARACGVERWSRDWYPNLSAADLR